MAKEVHRKLAAILAADVVGYSRLMEADEEATARTLSTYREIIEALVASHHGRVFGSAGDSVIAEFASPVEAVRCAVDIQRELEAHNVDLPEDRRMRLRIGVNLGDVMVEGDNLLGDGVNIAARLETLADPGGISLARSVFDQVRKQLDLGYEYLGEHEVKNIAEPVRVYRVLTAPEAAGKVIGETKRATQPWKWAALTAAMFLFIGAVVVVAWLRPWAPDVEPASLEAMAFPLPDKPSIAVLPFTNMSDDASQEYFSDGITEDLITDLSKISGLFVIARNSTFSYKGQQVTVRQVAEELGVRYVLEGSVRRAGDQVRINAQLIDATTGGHLWAERYSEREDDIFALQDRVLRAIVDALRIKLTNVDEDKLDHRPKPVNLAAYDWLLKGRKKLAEQDRQNAAMAKIFFQKAIKADPTYARTYTNLGFYYWNEWQLWGRDKKKNLARAQEIGHKAIDLDAKSAAAATLLAVTYQYQGDHTEAEKWADKAMALEPTLPETLGNLGGYLRHANRYREATQVLSKAIRLDPMHPPHWLSWLGHAYFMNDKPKEAIAVLEEAVAREPDYVANHVYLAGVFAEMGDIERAAAEKKEVLRLNANFTVSAFERYFASNTKDPTREKRLSAALRKAGLPE